MGVTSVSAQSRACRNPWLPGITKGFHLFSPVLVRLADLAGENLGLHRLDVHQVQLVAIPISSTTLLKFSKPCVSVSKCSVGVRPELVELLCQSYALLFRQLQACGH